MSKKYLTLQEALKQSSTDNLWVINNSANSELRLSGEIIIPIVDRSGRSSPINIQRTWLPVNLIEEMDRETILASFEFRKHLRNRLIRIITDEYAEQLLADPMAVTERNRLQSKRDKDKADQALGMAGTSGGIKVSTDGKDNNEQASSMYAKGISFAFKTWTDNLQARQEDDIISEFRSRARFTRHELRFLQKNLRDKPQVQEYVKQRLAKRKKKA